MLTAYTIAYMIYVFYSIRCNLYSISTNAQKQYWVELCSGMIVESNIRTSCNILDNVSPLEIGHLGNVVVSITVIVL